MLSILLVTRRDQPGSQFDTFNVICCRIVVCNLEALTCSVLTSSYLLLTKYALHTNHLLSPLPVLALAVGAAGALLPLPAGVLAALLPRPPPRPLNPPLPRKLPLPPLAPPPRGIVGVVVAVGEAGVDGIALGVLDSGTAGALSVAIGAGVALTVASGTGCEGGGTDSGILVNPACVTFGELATLVLVLVVFTFPLTWADDCDPFRYGLWFSSTTTLPFAILTGLAAIAFFKASASAKSRYPSPFFLSISHLVIVPYAENVVRKSSSVMP